MKKNGYFANSHPLPQISTWFMDAPKMEIKHAPRQRPYWGWGSGCWGHYDISVRVKKMFKFFFLNEIKYVTNGLNKFPIFLQIRIAR